MRYYIVSDLKFVIIVVTVRGDSVHVVPGVPALAGLNFLFVAWNLKFRFIPLHCGMLAVPVGACRTRVMMSFWLGYDILIFVRLGVISFQPCKILQANWFWCLGFLAHTFETYMYDLFLGRGGDSNFWLLTNFGVLVEFEFWDYKNCLLQCGFYFMYLYLLGPLFRMWVD